MVDASIAPTIMQESFDWLKPSSFWNKTGDDLGEPAFFRPVLLEYASDDFVEEFLADAAMSTSAALEKRTLDRRRANGGDEVSFKLYQPAHGRFYLVCATLSCRRPGLPDREVRLTEGENVFYVLRRLQGTDEYAWVPEGDNPGWQPLPDARRDVAENEERLPLFRTGAGNERDLYYAYVPTTSRESGPGDLSEIPAAFIDEVVGDLPQGDLRFFELETRFIAQLSNVDAAHAADLDSDPDTDNARRLSIYLLLDLWEYFERYLPNVAAHLAGDGETELSVEETALLNFLASSQALSFTGSSDLNSLRGLLEEVAPERKVLDELGGDSLPSPFDQARFLLTGRTVNPALWEAPLTEALDRVDALEARAKPEVSLPRVQTGVGEQYVIRCVYERPQCEPVQRWVSHATELFTLAPLYDPDAPARQINIALPSDISLGSLRKFQKGATFVMSQALRDKVSQVTGVDLGSGENADPGQLSLAYICSFSIPIITICAFILLLIIVIVLNFVFWWLPFLKICFPIPNRDAT